MVVLLTAVTHEANIPDLVRHRRATAAITSCRVIRDMVGKIKTTEPSIRQVQMHLFAEPSFRPDTEAIPNQQHPDQKFGINRRAARVAVEI
jgi:hypothetical protein